MADRVAHLRDDGRDGADLDRADARGRIPGSSRTAGAPPRRSALVAALPTRLPRDASHVRFDAVVRARGGPGLRERHRIVDRTARRRSALGARRLPQRIRRTGHVELVHPHPADRSSRHRVGRVRGTLGPRVAVATIPVALRRVDEREPGRSHLARTSALLVRDGDRGGRVGGSRVGSARRVERQPRDVRRVASRRTALRASR